MSALAKSVLALILGLLPAAQAVPGAFSLLAPANNATGVPLLPTLTWGPSAGAVSYTLEVASDAGFTNIVLSQAGIVATSYTPGAPVASGITVFWRVTAVNGNGSTLATGAPFTFTTLVLPPGPFALTAPANNATGVAVQPTFTWAASSGAATYTLEVASDPGFASLVVNQSGLGTTTFVPGSALNGGATYYWRVTAVNGGGSTGAAGAPFTFQTLTTGPGAFALLFPSHQSTGVGLNPSFFWDDAAGVDTYTIELATDPAFASPVFTVTGLPGSAFGSSLSLTANTVYYWRVTAINGTGSTTATVAPFRFQTGNFSTSGGSGSSGYVGNSSGCGLLGPEWLVPVLLLRRLRRRRA